MFSKLVPFIALATLLIPAPSRAVPGAAWVRRQEDAQSSPTLDPAVISHGLEQDGQGDNPDPGQVRSLTSSNNFINFCLPFLDQGVVLTNGAQVTAGSCNQTPMGRIISLDLAPRSKFVFPPNGDESIQPNTAFTVKMKLLNMQAGNFVNAATNYYAAPQQVNGQGIVIGHTHFVIEPIPSLDTTEPLDPLKFAFFKGINDPVDGNNIVQTSVTAGLKAGIYRICSINTAANHQPCLVSNAQHGALDDCSYFTIKDGGNTAAATSSASIAENASTTAAASASATESAAVSASNTDAASTSASTSDAAASSDSTSTSNAATDAATDAPQATQSAPADNSNSTDGAQSTSTPAPDSTSSTDAAAPTESSSADNGNNGGNNGNQGDNGSNNNNNGGDNQNAPSSDSASAPAPTEDSSSAPAPTEDSSSAPAPTDAASTDNAPSNAAPTDNAPSDNAPANNAPTDNSSAAPSPTDATPSDAAPSQGSDTGADNGNQGGNNGADAPSSTA